MFDQIEKLKKEYTDKYVMITEDRPELRRFAGYTGQVKTVNMSGRALVEFNANNNIGWFDINPAFLKVVDKPAEGAPARQTEAAPAKAAGNPAAKPAGSKSSTADILAAARANKAAGGAPAAKAPAAPKPAAATPAAPKPAAGGKMSTADILAAARAKKVGGEAPATTAPAEKVSAPAEEAPVAKPKAKPAAGGALPTTTAEKIAWMRAQDSK